MSSFSFIVYAWIHFFDKFGFIREKGKATARKAQWRPEAGKSLDSF
jgi:hypothetical protein